MDAAELLISARHGAALSKAGLAARAGTSRAALLAYESGRRSPTVATFARLLAACGLQVRGQLEPLHAQLDAAVEALLAGTQVRAPYGADEIARAFDAAGIPWALDGRSAMQAHGLAVEGVRWTEVAAPDSEALRTFLNDIWARPEDRDGMRILLDWHDLDMTALGPSPMYTRIGLLLLRVVDALPRPVRIELRGAVVPVLSLLDVEQASPSLARVLAHLRTRRTVSG